MDPKNVPNDVFIRGLAAWRRMKGLKQETLASMLGIKRGAYSTYERGTITMPPAIKKKLEIVGYEDPLAFVDAAEPGNASMVREHRQDYNFATFAPIRAWSSASAGFAADDNELELETTPLEAPIAFLPGGPSRLDRYDAVRVIGKSMEPRAKNGDRIIFFRDRLLYNNSIVLAISPEYKAFVKVLKEVGDHFELHSISEKGSRFSNIEGWKIEAYAIAILSDDVSHGPNVEFQFGRPLKVR